MCGFSSKTKLKDLDDLKTELIKMAAIVTINAINEINRELTLTVSLFLLIFVM
jgi:hypothetical protein